MQAVPMARLLLELLPGMGPNALIAHRVLRLMVAAGRPAGGCCAQVMPCMAATGMGGNGLQLVFDGYSCNCLAALPPFIPVHA